MRLGLTYTLVFIKNGTNILLGLKKRGFGKDKWNGFGGKVEINETIIQGAIRETKEESNLHVDNLNHIGVLTYEEQYCGTIDVVHVFTTNNYTVILQETEEMVPKCFKNTEIPFQKMWPDLKFWYEFMVNDNYFHAHTIYNDEETFKSCNVEQYNSFDDLLQNVNEMIKNEIY